MDGLKQDIKELKYMKYFFLLLSLYIVQLGPKLQSSAQVLAQSEHYIQGSINPPPNTTRHHKLFKGL